MLGGDRNGLGREGTGGLGDGEGGGGLAVEGVGGVGDRLGEGEFNDGGLIDGEGDGGLAVGGFGEGLGDGGLIEGGLGLELELETGGTACQSQICMIKRSNVRVVQFKRMVDDVDLIFELNGFKQYCDTKRGYKIVCQNH